MHISREGLSLLQTYPCRAWRYVITASSSPWKECHFSTVMAFSLTSFVVRANKQQIIRAVLFIHLNCFTRSLFSQPHFAQHYLLSFLSLYSISHLPFISGETIYTERLFILAIQYRHMTYLNHNLIRLWAIISNGESQHGGWSPCLLSA